MDTTPLEIDLLRNREFLLRLATSLVGRNDAEDLVQDVWVKAVEHPRPPGTGERGWLARVARNLAVNRFRSRARREGRERDAARPEATSDGIGEVQGRFDLGRRVADAVGALEAPYRDVILLRFFEGLAHAEIARRLEVPLATVRTRQQRALARLRERLDREAGGREAWSLALTGWLTPAASPGVPAAATGLGAALTAAALVAIVGGSAWWMTRGNGGEPAFVEALGAARPEGELAAQGSLVPDGAGASLRQPVASLQGVAAPRTRIAGRVVGLTVEELREAHVEVVAEWERYAHYPAPLKTALQDDGSFEVDVGAVLAEWDEPADEAVVVLDHPLHLLATSRVPTLPTSKRLVTPSGDTLFDAGELVPLDAAVARGLVYLPDGTPAAGAAVIAYYLDQGVPRKESAARARCDEEGRYDLRLERGGECMVAFLVEGIRPVNTMASLLLGRAVDLGTTTLDVGHAIEGRVTRLGSPMPQARVSVQQLGQPYVEGSGGSGITWLDGRIEWSHVVLEADAEGRFRCPGLAPATYSVSADGAARLGSLGFRRESIQATAPCAHLALEFRASLVTLERAPGSQGNVDGRLDVDRPGRDDDEELWFHSEGDQPLVTFVAPPDTTLSLNVALEGRRPPIALELETPGPGKEIRWPVAFSDPEPQAPLDPGSLATLELEWIPDPRLSPKGLWAYFESPEGEHFHRAFRPGDAVDGIFRIEGVRPGRHRVRIVPRWDGRIDDTLALDRTLSVELAPGATTRERFAFELGGILRLDVRAASGERCAATYRVLDGAGEEIPVRFQTKRGDQERSDTCKLVNWAEHQSEVLPAGDYTLVLWTDALPEQRFPVRLTAGEFTELTVTLQAR